MQFNEYQKESGKTRVAHSTPPVLYTTLGLVGEAGEVAEKVKKLYRDDGGTISEERRELLKKELGDVLWYIAQLAHDLDLELEDIATHNLEKLAERQQKNRIHGDGDTR